jgi:membrane protease YdiL (CAAX protease family)
MKKILAIIQIVSFYLIAIYLGETAFKQYLVWPAIHSLSHQYPSLKNLIHLFVTLDYGRIVGRIADFIGVMLVYLFFIRVIDKISFAKSVFFPKASKLKFFLQGFLIGLNMLAITTILTLASGSVTLDPINGWFFTLLPIMLLYAFLQLLTATTEELILRGYVLDHLAKVMNPVTAVLITSMVFGYWHLQYSYLYAAGAMIFGLIAGFGYIYTQNLYLCIGIHYAWNLVESVIYSQSLFKLSVHNVFLGGEKNVTPDQQGILMMPGLLIGLAFVIIVYRKKERSST